MLVIWARARMKRTIMGSCLQRSTRSENELPPNDSAHFFRTIPHVNMRGSQAELTQDFLKTGIEILGINPASSLKSILEIYRHNFKYSPSRCAFIYLHLIGHPLIPDEFGPKHLLWTLYFLLTYGTERRLCCIFKADRKTIRKYTWPTISAIATLAEDYVSCTDVECHRFGLHLTGILTLELVSRTKIRWDKRLIGDDGRPAKVTVDGTDFETIEYSPFNPGRRSHKFNHAGLRYEVAISIAKCFIVHINGPFICGEWPDIRIARTCLHEMLEPDEYYLADSGYRCGRGPAITREALPPHQRSTFDRLMARHEIINRRFKEFAILGSRFRHEEEKHGDVFRCVAVLVQFDLEEGNVPFDVL